MSQEIKTIGVLTSGGDAPGMNAVVRAVVRKALTNGVAVKGIKKGYQGLLNEEIVDMNASSVSDIIQKGGHSVISGPLGDTMNPAGLEWMCCINER